MPLCGFNEKMLKGLNAFNEGLIEHGLVFRGEKNGETLEQGIRRELSDMVRLLQELQHIDDASKRVITEGIVKYALGFYMVMRKKGFVDDSDNYKEMISSINEYFHAMDDKYYGELEGRPDDMQELVKFLDNKEI